MAAVALANRSPPVISFSDRPSVISMDVLDDSDAILKLAKDKGIELEPQAGPGKAKTELFELLVEEKLINPTFVTAYPTEVSPLARRNEKNPQTHAHGPNRADDRVFPLACIHANQAD